MRGLTLSTILGLALGCASTGTPPSGRPGEPVARTGDSHTGVEVRIAPDAVAPSAVLESPVDTVWAVLPDAYRAMGIDADVNDERLRQYGTRRFSRQTLMGRRTLDYVRCAHEMTGPSAVSGRRVRLTVLTTVRPEGLARARLETEVSGEASAIDGTSTQAVACVTNGRIEMRLGELVEELLGGRRKGVRQ